MNSIRDIRTEEFFLLKNNTDRIKFLLRYAILAPSTHNTQPWIFKIGSDYCRFFFNPQKRLPNTDRRDRGLYISMGACIENFILIAKYFNVYKEFNVILNRNLVAEVTLNFKNKNVINKELKKVAISIPLRSNKRGKFINKIIPRKLEKKFISIAGEYKNVSLSIVSDGDKKQELANLTAEGIIEATHRSKFRAEIASWLHNNLSKKKEGMGGYSFNLPLLPSLIFPYLIRYLDLGKISSLLSKKNLLTASHICIITAKNDNKKSWLSAGRLAERLMIEAQAEGISSTINIGAIEIGTIYTKVMTAISTKEKPLFLFTLGYMKGNHKFTPRIELENKIIA